ncbi:MAG: methylcobamide--CoM methyltransferase [Candidatus Hydrogenedentota bacterium]
MGNRGAAWIDQIRKRSARSAMPIMSYPGLVFAGGTVRDVVTRADAQVACIRALNETYPTIAVLAPMDLSVEAEAFGCRVAFHDDDIPTVTAPCIQSPADQSQLAVPEIGAARTGVYLDAAERLAKHFCDRPVFAGMIGPFSLAVRLRNMTEIMLDLMLEPDCVANLLERCTAFQIQYARAFKACGAGGVIMAEPAAGLLAPQQCEAFSSRFIAGIVDAVQDESFLVILHNCGQVTQSIASMVGTGVRCIHVGNAVNMLDILPQVPENVLVCGNIDPAGAFRNGTADHVYSTTTDLLNRTREYPNFVLSSGCDIPPGTPIENINAFYRALLDFDDTP